MVSLSLAGCLAMDAPGGTLLGREEVRLRGPGEPGSCGGREAGSRVEVPDQILDRCRAGDPAAFAALFEALKDHVYGLALSFTGGDEAAAGDVAQEVFVKLLTRIRQFRRRSEFTTWLYRVVANTFLDHRRRAGRWLPLEDPGESPDLLTPPVQEGEAVGRQVAAEVRRGLADLSPALRLPLILRYVAGLPYRRIAEVLEVAPGTVASRLNRGHRQLAQRLAHLKDFAPPRVGGSE